MAKRQERGVVTLGPPPRNAAAIELQQCHQIDRRTSPPRCVHRYPMTI